MTDGFRPKSAVRPDVGATAVSKVEQPFEQPSRPASFPPERPFKTGLWRGSLSVRFELSVVLHRFTTRLEDRRMTC